MKSLTQKKAAFSERSLKSAGFLLQVRILNVLIIQWL